MANQIVHFEIAGKSAEVLHGFYTALFDWKLNEAMPGYTLVDPGAGVKGGIATGMEGPGHVTVYVQVENVEKTLAEVEARGGKKVFGPHTIPDGAIIGGFLDPEGHMMGILQAPKGMRSDAA